MKKLKIFTFPDRNPEYLQLQIDSYKIYVEDADTELIVVNASTSHADEIDTICRNNSIKSIKYTGNNNGFKTYYVEQLNWFRDTIQKDISDYILLIHSDMFFINKFDYKNLMYNKKIIINPQYRLNNSLYYMWDGVLLFDSEYINENNLRNLFIWNSVEGISDMGGQTSSLLKNINQENIDFFEFWTVYNINGNTLETTLNGNIWFTFDMQEKKIREEIPMGNKCFPYEDENENYNDYYTNKMLLVKENFSDKYNFPHPVYFDLIQIKNGDLLMSPILHLKSGSGYQNWYNSEYIKQKLSELNKIIKK